MKIIIPHEGGCLLDKDEKIIPVDWERRHYELAKAAMQGFCANSHDSIAIAADSKIVAEWSVGFANAMIEKLKGD